MRCRRFRVPAWPAAAVALVLVLTGCADDDDAATRVASGHVEATEVRIATKIGGRLATLNADEGDTVTVGEPLASIDPVDLELALQAARASRDAAAAQLELRRAGPTREEVAEARSAVDRAEAELAGARRDLERFASLLERGSGTEKSRDDAATRVRVASETVDGLRQRLLRVERGSREEEIDAAAARLAGAEAQIAQLEQQLRDATIASPVAGVVSARLAEPGELVPAGAPLLVVTDLAHPWLTVYVDEPSLGALRLGAPAEVVTDAGERRRGTITYIASQAEFTPKNVQTRDERTKLVYRVKIALDNADGLFKPGMPGEARLDLAEPAPGDAPSAAAPAAANDEPRGEARP